MSIVDALETEDAVLLTALLMPRPQPLTPPSDASVQLCGVALSLSAAQDAGLRSSVASVVARATLHARISTSAPQPLLPAAELAHALDSQLADLVEIWNVSVPKEFSASEPEQLADAILSARNAVAADNADTITATAAADFASARARAIRLQSATTALEALELDTEERHSAKNTADAAVASTIARGNAVVAKLRLLRATVAAELYDAPAVSALRNASRALEARLAELEPMLGESAATIARYRAVEAEHGDEFGRIVRDYRTLMRELEEKKWSLKELGVEQ